MITEFLMERSTLLPLALLGVAAVCMCAGFLILRDRRLGGRAAWTLVLLTALPVPVLTLTPTPRGDPEQFCAVQFTIPSLESTELLANLALLFPVIFFATIATRRPFLVLLAGAGLSAAIEWLQAVIPGNGRSCDTNDWVMNTAGAIAAVVLAVCTLAMAKYTRRTPR